MEKLYSLNSLNICQNIIGLKNKSDELMYLFVVQH